MMLYKCRSGNQATPASRQHQQLDHHLANIFIDINYLQRTQTITKVPLEKGSKDYL